MLSKVAFSIQHSAFSRPALCQKPAALGSGIQARGRIPCNLQLHRHGVLRVTPIVESLACLFAIPSSEPEPLEQRWRREPLLLEFVIHHMGDVVGSIESDEI